MHKVEATKTTWHMSDVQHTLTQIMVGVLPLVFQPSRFLDERFMITVAIFFHKFGGLALPSFHWPGLRIRSQTSA